MKCGEQMKQMEDSDGCCFVRKISNGKLKIVETTEQRSLPMAMHTFVIIKMGANSSNN